jgi:hypothetical protein
MSLSLHHATGCSGDMPEPRAATTMIEGYVEANDCSLLFGGRLLSTRGLTPDDGHQARLLDGTVFLDIATTPARWCYIIATD